MLSTNLEKIYTSPYRSFNFQQLFYDIFFAQREFYKLSVVKVYDSQPIFGNLWIKRRKLFNKLWTALIKILSQLYVA